MIRSHILYPIELRVRLEEGSNNDTKAGNGNSGSVGLEFGVWGQLSSCSFAVRRSLGRLAEARRSLSGRSFCHLRRSLGIFAGQGGPSRSIVRG